MAQVTLTISAEDNASGALSKIAEGLNKISQQSTEASQKTVQAQTAIRQGLEQTGSGIRNLGGAIEGLVGNFQQFFTVGNLFGSLVGIELVHSIHSAMEATIEWGMQMNRLMLLTGDSMSSIAELEGATTKMGLGSDKLARAMFFLSREIEAGGTNLAKYGIAIRANDGNMKTDLTIMMEAADKYKELGSAAAGAAFVRHLMGRQGADLIPLFGLERDAIHEMGAEMKDFAESVGPEGVKTARELKGAFAEIEEATMRLKVRLTLDLAGGLTLLANSISYVIDSFQKMDSDTRILLEALVGLGALFVALTTLVGAFKYVITALVESSFVAWLETLGVAISATTFFWATAAVAVVYYRKELVDLGDWITGGWLSTAANKLWDFAVGTWNKGRDAIREWRGMLSVEGEQALRDTFTKAPQFPGAGDFMPSGNDVDPKNTGELQKELLLLQTITQARIKLAQATMDQTFAGVAASRLQQEMDTKRIQNEIDSGKFGILSERQKQEILNGIVIEGAAKRAKLIEDLHIKQFADDDKLMKAQAAATMAGEELFRETARLDIATAQNTYESKVRLYKNDANSLAVALQERDRSVSTAEATLNQKMRQLGVERIKSTMDLAVAMGAASEQGAKFGQEAIIRGLDAEQAERKLVYDQGRMSIAEFTAAEILASQQRLASEESLNSKQMENLDANRALERIKLAVELKDKQDLNIQLEKFDVETNTKRAALIDELAKKEADARKREFDFTVQGAAEEIRILSEANQKKVEASIAAAEKILASENATNRERLQASADLFKSRKTLYDNAVQAAIDAGLKETDLYKNDVNKQLAIEAGKFEQIQKYRDDNLKNAATVAEKEARLAGDTSAAYVAGFAEAASSAKDAFSAMRSAGQETFNALKSGASDFLFEILSTSGKIGNIFVNLGKRILRTMTDVFAEILVKQLAMAAGFSLPGLLGFAGTAVAGAALPGLSAAETEIVALGNAATGSATQLTGLGGVTQLLMGIFGLFGQGLLSLLSFLGSLFSVTGAVGGVAGVAGAVTSVISAVTKFGSGLLSTLGTIGGAISAIVSGLTNGTLSLSGAIGQMIGSIGVNVAASFGASAATLGAIQSASLMLGQAIPVLGAIVSAAFAIKQFIEGDTATKIAMSIGLALGGPFGAILGGLFGGLFSGPTPQISGKTVLRPTTMEELMATQHVTKDQVVNPKGRSQFSYLEAGPIYEEMYKHRTEGALERTKSQEIIMNILIDTLKVAFMGLDRFVSQLPVGHIRDMISQRIDTILATGFEITDFNVKGDNAVNKFGKYLKALSEKTLQTVFSQVFGDIDLKKLGGGDLVKGLDTLSTAIATVAAIADAAGTDFSHSAVTIQELSKNTIDFFTKFQQKDEALIDTIKRVGESFAGIIQLIHDTDTTIAVASGDASQALKILQDSFAAVERNAVAAADALTVAVESGATTDAVLKAGQDAMKAVNDALNAEVQAVTKLHDAVLALDKALNDGLDQFVNLESQIRSLGGATLSTAETIPHLIEAFDQLMAVGSKISLWTGGMKLIIAEGGNLIDQMPLISAGFNVIMQQIRGLANPQEAIADLKSMADGINAALSAGIASIQARYAALKQASQAHIDNLNTQKTAISASYDVQLTALKAQRDVAAALNTEQLTALKTQRDAMVQANATQIDALKTQLSLAQQWQSVLESIRSQLTDLYNLLAPTHPLTSLNEVRAQFDAARAAFAAGPTAEGATRVQDLAKQLIDIAKQTPGYDLPSAAFQGLAGDVQSALESIASFAVAQPSAEAIQARIAELEGRQTGLLASIDAQIATLTAQQQAATAAIDAQITTTTAQRDAAVSAIDAQIASANAALQSILTSLSQQEQAEIVELQRIAAGGLQQIRDELGNRLLELQAQEAQASAALRAIIGDKTFEQYIAERQALALIWLSSINDTLKHYLGAIVAAIVPGATVGGIGVGMQEIRNAANDFKTLSELAQGANRPTLANALAQASLQTGAQDVAGLLTSLQRASGIMQDIPWFHDEGAGILGTFNSILGLTQNGDFQTAILSLSKLVSDVLGAGITARSPVPGFAEGLDFVPRDNFPARLHYGERVLTKEENAALGSRLNGGSSNIVFAPTITVTGFTNARQLADELESVLVEKMQSGSRLRQATKALAEGRG